MAKRDPKRLMISSVIKDMKSLNVYKPEYDRLIHIYVDLNMQYDKALLEFERTGQQYETETGAGGSKKSAIVSTLESLRKDIITYSDRLCLNPKTLDNIKAQVEKKSSLAEMLKDI